ncbi:hypothetical protein ACIB24_14910 [Spongisporangium articulatum]|uniref:Sap, sulfolipid-1-addressing protein n=1 Tax=Spongisporangium articulatum TaxID=3362603 RepID=A0ABW8APU0_9ACTN
METAALLTHVLPLALIAAVSPVMFVNASRVTLAGGPASGARFAGGAWSVLVVLGVTAMGVMGAAVTELVKRELASRWVDAFLAVLLLAYGGFQLARHRAATRHGDSDEPDVDRALPSTPGGITAAGALGMATNFTSLPLYISLAQLVGASALAVWAKFTMLAAASLVVLTPAWLPAVLAVATAGARLPSETGTIRARIMHVARWVSIGSCFVGGALILLHVIMG